LNKFLDLELSYIHEIVEAYSDLWSEKAKLPWDDIWQKLLEFCSNIIKQGRFWISEFEERSGPFVANRYWIVSSIGRLIETGTASDDHAFSEKYLGESREYTKISLG